MERSKRATVHELTDDQEKLYFTRALTGDRAAYNILLDSVKMWLDVIIRRLRSKGCTSDEKDLRQEAIDTLVGCWYKWQQRARFSTFAFRVFRNAMGQVFRKDIRADRLRATLIDDTLDRACRDPEAIVVNKCDREARRAQLARYFPCLCAAQQEVLRLRFGHGLSIEQTAGVMGKRVDAIKSLQLRATRTLSSLMGGNCHEAARQSIKNQ